jgi:hypothetical protein
MTLKRSFLSSLARPSAIHRSDTRLREPGGTILARCSSTTTNGKQSMTKVHLGRINSQPSCNTNQDPAAPIGQIPFPSSAKLPQPLLCSPLLLPSQIRKWAAGQSRRLNGFQLGNPLTTAAWLFERHERIITQKPAAELRRKGSHK